MLIAVLSRKRSLYSTRRLIEAAVQKGHEALALDPLQCSLGLGPGAPAIYYRGLDGRLPPVDVVLPRIGVSVTEAGLAVVNQFDMMGVPLVNHAQAIARSRDKLRALQLLVRAGVDVPRTVLARHPSQVHRALEMVGGPPAILKLMRSTQGIGVVLAETEQAAQQVVETLWSLGVNVLIQEFVEESEGRDIRVVVVGQRAVAAMRRQARVGEFRSNVHRGATGQAVDLPTDYARAALRATRAMRLQLAGVDLLESSRGPQVLEVNSSPGLEGIEQCTGIDVAGAVIEYAVAFARRSARRRRVAI
jgi:ribosomal protein S6--L-glutamate ligase